jgi:hypothetical protein
MARCMRLPDTRGRHRQPPPRGCAGVRALNGLYGLLGVETEASDAGFGFMTDFPANILGFVAMLRHRRLPATYTLHHVGGVAQYGYCQPGGNAGRYGTDLRRYLQLPGIPLGQGAGRSEHLAVADEQPVVHSGNRPLKDLPWVHAEAFRCALSGLSTHLRNSTYLARGCGE